MTIRMFIVLPLLLLAGTPSRTAGLAQSAPPRVIEITAERFQFWPSRIAVSEGEEVELRVRSDDTMHGFRIIGVGTNLEIPKRGQRVCRHTIHRQPTRPIHLRMQSHVRRRPQFHARRDRRPSCRDRSYAMMRRPRRRAAFWVVLVVIHACGRDTDLPVGRRRAFTRDHAD